MKISLYKTTHPQILLKFRFAKIFVIFFSIISILICLGDSTAQDAGVVVIVHPSISDLTSSQIKRIFRGDVDDWPGGGGVKVLLNSNAGITNEFCKKYLKMSPTRLDNMWVKKSIRDGVPTPRKIPSNVIITMVSHSPKFIGFVLRSEAGSGVKILE